MSFHAGQTFTFGEQPSATKWQYLWDNDYALADGTGISDAAIINRHIAPAVVEADNIKGDTFPTTSFYDDAKIFWEEIGRVTAGGTITTQTTPTMAAKKYLIIISTWLPTGGANAANIRFNGDTGNNYNFRYNTNGGAETTSLSQSSMASGSQASGGIGVSIRDVINFSGQEKIVNYRETLRGTAGAGNATDRYELSGKWASSAQVTTVTHYATSNSLAAGSELIVLGHN